MFHAVVGVHFSAGSNQSLHHLFTARDLALIAHAIQWSVSAAVGGIAYYLHTQRTEPPPVAAAQPAPETPAPAPQSHYPIEEEPAAAPAPPKPLPGLDESDAEAQASLGGVFSQQTLIDLFQLKGIIRRIVATIDNLPRDKVAGRLLAVKPVPGHFAVDGAEGSRSVR